MAQLEIVISDNQFEELKKELDVSERNNFKVVHRKPREASELGCLYNINEDKSIFPKLSNVKNESTLINILKQLENEIPSSSEENPKQNQINFIFKECEETISDPDPIKGKTIRDSIFAHVVYSQIKGFQAEIHLNTEDDTADLHPIIDLICQKNLSQTDQNIPTLSYSISGKLPDFCIQENEEAVDLNNLEPLYQFQNEEFYKDLGEPLTLSVEIVPVELNHYFSPLIEKVAQLKTRFSSSYDGKYQSMIDSITTEILNKIKLSAQSIKSGQNYLEMNRCLQQINKSFILDHKSMSDLIDNLESSIEKEKVKLDDITESQSENDHILVDCDVNICLSKPMDKIIKPIMDIIEGSQKTLTKKQLLLDFDEELRSEFKISNSKLQEFKPKINSLIESNIEEKFVTKYNFVTSRRDENPGIEVKLSKNGQLIDENLPTFEAPQNIQIIQESEENSIALFSISDQAKQFVHGYRVQYKSLDPADNQTIKSEEKSSNEWQSETRQDGNVSIVMNIPRPETHSLRIQMIYDGLSGICSEWNQFKSTTLTSAPDPPPEDSNLSEDYFQTDELLKIKNPYEFKLQRIPQTDCELMCLYNLKENQAIYPKLSSSCRDNMSLNSVAQKLNVEKLSSDNPCQSRSRFTFRDSEESLNNFDSLQPKTIRESPYAHFICSQVKGYQADITLTTDEENKDILRAVEKMIYCKEKPSQENMADNIFFSVCGKLPDEFKKENIEMDKDDLLNLRQFHNSDFYSEMEERITLDVTIVPFDLERYFKPLLEKIRNLQQTFQHSTENLTRSIVDKIIEGVIRQIKMSADLIKRGEDYLSVNQFLQLLLKSFLLDPSKIENMFKNCQSMIDTEIQDLVSFADDVKCDSSQKKKDSLEIQCSVNLSIKSGMIQLESLLEEIFQKQQNAPQQKHFLENFESKLKAEKEIALTHLKEIREKYNLLMECNSENDICFKSDVIAVDHTEQTLVQIQLLQNGKSIDYQSAIFEAPKDIQAAKVNNDSVTLNWSHSEENKKFVRQYRVNYRLKSPEVTDNDWTNEFSEDNNTSLTISRLKPGLYEFKVQAIYEGFSGLFSEMSSPISTLIAQQKSEKAKEILRKISDEKEYSRIVSLLEVPHLLDDNSEISLRIDADKACEIGCLYDIDEDKVIRTKLQFTESSSVGIPKNLKWKTNHSEPGNPDQKNIQVFYKKTRESLTNLDSLNYKTIKETPLAHFVHSKIKGFQTIIELSSEGENKHLLKDIWGKILDSDSINEEDLKGMELSYSVSGKLPDYMLKEKQPLEYDDIESIRKFLHEEHYDNMEECCTLEASVIPVNLEIYFQPIFEALLNLKETFPAESKNVLHQIVHVIVQQTKQKVRNTVKLIKSHEKYVSETKALQELHKSTLLSPQKLENLFKEISSIIEIDERNLLPEQWRSSDDSNKFHVECCVNLSLKSVIEEMKTTVLQCFDKSDFKIDKKNLFQKVSDIFDREKQTVVTEFQKAQTKLKSLHESNEKNFVVSFVLNTSDQLEEAGAQIRFYNGESLLQYPPILFDPPTNLASKLTTDDSVTFCWNPPKCQSNTSTNFKYKIEYMMVEDKEASGAANSWQSVTSSTPEVNLKELKRGGVYLFRVQTVHDGIMGVFSEMSDPVHTLDINVCLEEVRDCLKSFTEEDECSQILATLQTANLLQNISTKNDCNIGSSFNIRERCQVSPKNHFRTQVSTKRLKKELKLTSTFKNSQRIVVNIIYEDHEEELSDSRLISQKTIEDTEYPHYVYSKLFGLRVEVELTGNEKQLEEFVKHFFARSPSMKDCNTSGLIVTVSGDIPRTHHLYRKTLNRENKEILMNLTDERFFKNLGSPPPLNIIGLKMMNLDHFFSPLFKKLSELHSLTLRSQNNLFRSIIDLIMKITMEKITSTAELIKSGKDSQSEISFLQKLLNSLLLDSKDLTEILTLFENVSSSEVKSFQESFANDEDLERQNWVEISVNISLHKTVESVKSEIGNCFRKNEIQGNLQQNLQKKFKERLSQECDIASRYKDEIRKKVSKWIKENEIKDVQIKIHSTKNLSLEGSNVDVEFYRNNNIVNPLPPIFDAPREIKPLITTEDSITLVWATQATAKNFKHSYRICYLMLENPENKDISQTDWTDWENILTDNQESEISIEDLTPGIYVFRIQMIFQDFPGIFSELSDHIPTQGMETNLGIRLSSSSSSLPDFQAQNLRKEKNKTINPFKADCALGDLFDVSVMRVNPIRTPQTMNSDQLDFKNRKPVLSFDEGTETDHINVYREVKITKCLHASRLKPINFPEYTILETTVAHIVSAIFEGNFISLRLTTNKNNRNCLIEKCNEMFPESGKQSKVGLWKRTTKYFTKEYWTGGSEISYQISSNCGKSKEKKSLDGIAIDKLKKLKKSKKLEKQASSCQVYIKIAPINLNSYFKPIEEKIIELKSELSNRNTNSPDCTEVITFVESQVKKKIKETSRIILDFENDYESSTKFLQNLLHSFLLTMEGIEKLIERFSLATLNFQDAVQEHDLQLEQNSSPKSFKVQFIIGLDISTLDHLKVECEKCFESNIIPENSSVLIEKFKSSIKTNREQYFQQIKNLQRCNSERNANICYEVVFSKESRNPIEIKLYKNDEELKQNISLLEGPKDIEESQSTKNSITLKWKPPQLGDSHIRSYRIDYKKLDKDGNILEDWKSIKTNSNQRFHTVSNLTYGKYVFRVQAFYDDIAGVFSEESKSFETRICLAELIVAHLEPIKDEKGIMTTPKVYQLPLETKALDQSKRRRACSYGPYEENSLDQRTIILLGATGSGKSTFINGLVNYIFNVDWSDDFRFKIIDSVETERKKSQTKSQTEWITKYQIRHREGTRTKFTLNIIDTPGFGDTEGIQRDFAIFDQIKELFQSEHLLHAVCIFITCSSLRLTAPQKYVFDTILSIFGNDIKNNIFILVTFADHPKPPVIETLKESDVPFTDYFVFNNSALYENNQGGNSFDFSQMFWNLGVESFKTFLKKIEETEPVSLQLTKEVLHNREIIEVSIETMQRDLKKGLSKLETLRQHKLKLEEHKNRARDNENFNYSVEETHQDKVNLEPGKYVTNCLQCNRTCHFPCKIPRNADKKGCYAMNSEGYCRLCPNKCFWDLHVNNEYRFELKTVKVTKEYSEMKKEYGIAEKGIRGLQRLVDEIQKDYEDIQARVADIINDIKNMVNRLRTIALLPNSLNLKEYINLLIESEKQEQKPGYPARITELNKIKNKIDLLKTIETQDNCAETLFQTLDGETSV